MDDVEQRGKIEHVLRNAVHGARRPGAVAVAAEIERINVVMFAQRPRYPVPVARVVQPAVDQHQCWLAVLPVIPKLQLQPVGIKEMRDWFHVFLIQTIVKIVEFAIASILTCSSRFFLGR